MDINEYFPTYRSVSALEELTLILVGDTSLEEADFIKSLSMDVPDELPINDLPGLKSFRVGWKIQNAGRLILQGGGKKTSHQNWEKENRRETTAKSPQNYWRDSKTVFLGHILGYAWVLWGIFNFVFNLTI